MADGLRRQVQAHIRGDAAGAGGKGPKDAAAGIGATQHELLLFDLRSDPPENEDLAARPDLVKQFLAEFRDEPPESAEATW